MEFWTPGALGLGELPRYAQETSMYLKSVRDLPVLGSPFISDLGVDPETTRAVFTTLLQAADIDIVALQDGVGARQIPTSELATRVRPWLEATQAACDTAGCETWLNAESFFGPNAAAPDGVEAQLGIASTHGLLAVTFEFSNYWIDEDGSSNELYDWYFASQR